MPKPSASPSKTKLESEAADVSKIAAKPNEVLGGAAASESENTFDEQSAAMASPAKHATRVTQVTGDNAPNPYEVRCTCGWSARFSHAGLAANEGVNHERSFAASQVR